MARAAQNYMLILKGLGFPEHRLSSFITMLFYIIAFVKVMMLNVRSGLKFFICPSGKLNIDSLNVRFDCFVIIYHQTPQLLFL